ncbi:hypothetical protein OAK65_00660 [Synechococcus sp. AH-551-N17]|nr:hypothetical protein [Synechococcus sp. AH-551-N17]
MELADLRDRFPALDGLLVQITGLLTRQRVVLAASDRVLSLAWWEQGEQRIINTDLPPDLCQGGVPLQREVLAEMVADLLIEQGISSVSVELELLLPLPICDWRLLEGAAGLGDATSLRALAPEMTWPLHWQESYVALTALNDRDMAIVVGADRLILQAWIDTVVSADLNLCQAEWLLVAAWRALQALNASLEGEWVWLIESEGIWRLVLLREGLPELDVALKATQLPSVRDEVLFLLDAWDKKQLQIGVRRSWWITAGPRWKGRWQEGHGEGLHGPLVSDGEMSLLQLALRAPSAENKS